MSAPQLKPATFLLYGPMGIGKSLAAIKAFGKKAKWISSERGAITAAYDKELNPSGEIPDYVEVLDSEKPYETTKAAMDAAAKECVAGKYAVVVWDGMSTWANREMARIHAAGVRDEYGKASNLLNERLGLILSALMNTDALLVCIAHQRDPSTIEGKVSPGGPAVQGKGVQLVPALFDVVLRCAVETMPDMTKKRVFRIDPLDTATWQTKDRFNVVEDKFDMNLFEVARRCELKRRGIDWKTQPLPPGITLPPKPGDKPAGGATFGF